MAQSRRHRALMAYFGTTRPNEITDLDFKHPFLATYTVIELLEAMGKLKNAQSKFIQSGFLTWPVSIPGMTESDLLPLDDAIWKIVSSTSIRAERLMIVETMADMIMVHYAYYHPVVLLQSMILKDHAEYYDCQTNLLLTALSAKHIKNRTIDQLFSPSSFDKEDTKTGIPVTSGPLKQFLVEIRRMIL
jgi:hypothetical protein